LILSASARWVPGQGEMSRDLGDTTLKIEWRYLSRTTRDELGRDDDGLHR
jgi:hypothetical protein